MYLLPLAYDSAAPQPDYDTGFDPGFDFEPDAQYWANQDTQQIQDNNGFETADTPAVDQSKHNFKTKRMSRY